MTRPPRPCSPPDTPASRPAFEARGCAAERLRIEDEARSQGLGLWADPRYAVVDAADAEALRRNGGRLVVIEGRVRRVGFGRSRLYLDMVPKGGPTIVVPRKLEPAFAGAGHSLDAAAGADDSCARGARQPFGPETRGQRAGDDRIFGAFGRVGRGQAASMIDCVPGNERPQAGAHAWRRGLMLAAVALSLGLAACASVEPPPAPDERRGGADRSRGRSPRRPSPERKRLIDAFGGEYRAPATEAFLERRSRQARAGFRRREPALSRHPARFPGRQRLRPAFGRHLHDPRPASRSPTTRPRSPP